MAYPVRSYSHESAGTASSSAGAAAAAPPVDDAHLGAWRSRTLLFLSYRSSAPRPSTSAFASSSRSSFESPLLGGDLESQSAPQRARRPGTYYDASGALASYPPAAAEALPPRWVDTSDAVEALLQGIGPKMERLERMHAKHLLPGFVDRRAEERAIETLTQEITKVRSASRRWTTSADMHNTGSAQSHVADSAASQCHGCQRSRVRGGTGAQRADGSRNTRSDAQRRVSEAAGRLHAPHARH